MAWTSSSPRPRRPAADSTRCWSRPDRWRDAQDLAADTFGSRQTFFVTNGTSTANKIVVQALVEPGDIVMVDPNCHQSHHYGLVQAGAHVSYLEAYGLNEYSIYGAVPLREIKRALLAFRREGKLDRVKLLMLTNCTFDGIIYDVERVMEECLAIKPDLVFLWDEAWSRSRASTPCIASAPRWRPPRRCWSDPRTRTTGAAMLPSPSDSPNQTPTTRRCWICGCSRIRSKRTCASTRRNRRTRHSPHCAKDQ